MIYSCFLCGSRIHDFNIPNYDTRPAPTAATWPRQFRAIYSDPSGSFVTGVGCRFNYEGTVWWAPQDPSRRWDDEHEPIDIPIMQQPARHGRHGFVIHEACWQLLRIPFLPSEVPLRRVLDVLESLPLPWPGVSVYWGHDYGNLLVMDDQNLYPWEISDLDFRWESLTYLCAIEDPYNMPDISSALSTCKQNAPAWSPSTQSSNCFSKLPWEILEDIALTLPTEDALGLRHVSPVFLPILYSQTFWASRFKANSDRCYVFEKWEARDSPDRCSPGLKNRKRIWDLITPLTETIRLRLAETQISGSQDFTSLRWTKVEGALHAETDIRRNGGFLQAGCRLFGTHIGKIPENLWKIGFSTSNVGTVTYISGLRLIAYKSPGVCLGYMSETNEVILEVTALRGFILAFDKHGLHALQIVRGDRSLSEWIGCPGNTPVTKRLAGFEGIDYLEVGFDGFKIVNLGVSPPAQTPEAQIPSLREVALWYPSVPGPELCLNETSFTSEAQSSTRYQPLVWIQFGGPRGCRLSHITKLSVEFVDGLCGVEFHYDSGYEQEGSQMQKLGRQKDENIHEKEDFVINGAGSEFIEAVEIGLQLYPNLEPVSPFIRPSKLNTIKITTNRERSYQAGYSTPDTSPVLLSIKPGTTLTGFYASQHQGGLGSIGAISEFLDEQPMNK